MSDDKKIKQEENEKNDIAREAAPCLNCEKLNKELSDCIAGWQRALADYQNLTKETDRRRAEWAVYARQMILEEFIPIYDNLKLAISNEQLASDKNNGCAEGIKHILKQFVEVLKNNGVEEIKTVGEKFDPIFHEATGEEEGEKPGIIIKEISGGYKMGESVIRAAKVIVAK